MHNRLHAGWKGLLHCESAVNHRPKPKGRGQKEEEVWEKRKPKNIFFSARKQKKIFQHPKDLRLSRTPSGECGRRFASCSRRKDREVSRVYSLPPWPPISGSGPEQTHSTLKPGAQGGRRAAVKLALPHCSTINIHDAPASQRCGRGDRVPSPARFRNPHHRGAAVGPEVG